MCTYSVQIHRCDLALCAVSGNYVTRQVGRWSKQYQASKTHDIDAMDKLMKWLADKAPVNDTTTVVHGDFRCEPAASFLSSC